ncbi:MAG: HAD hydrolase family protein [Elusimicrobia bacterium]|nr:HAD hydrolase family protein [Elusimicrobiota bacterium]
MRKKTISRGILARAKKIKIIVMDVDGVLTKGELIILDSGEEMKIWDIKDRLAYTIIRKSGLGIKLAWITGRESRQVTARAKELKIDYVYQGVADKLKPIEEIIKKGGYRYEDVCYIGDDWLDIPILKRAGLAVCPADAVPDVFRYAHHRTKVEGGKGVLREVAEIILKSQSAFNKVFGGYAK